MLPIIWSFVAGSQADDARFEVIEGLPIFRSPYSSQTSNLVLTYFDPL